MLSDRSGLLAFAQVTLRIRMPGESLAVALVPQDGHSFVPASVYSGAPCEVRNRVRRCGSWTSRYHPRMPRERRVRRRPVPRIEDAGLLTGATSYLEDFARGLCAVFVRPRTAHARIGSIDMDEARRMPGVAGVFTAADLPGLRMPSIEDLPDALRRPLLATDVVHFVGEPIAVVLAATHAQAIDAAEIVGVDHDPLPVVTDSGRALDAEAPLLFPDHGSNLVAVIPAK